MYIKLPVKSDITKCFISVDLLEAFLYWNKVNDITLELSDITWNHNERQEENGQ